jgi:uncharacterized protein YecA (UPF0149 family)
MDQENKDLMERKTVAVIGEPSPFDSKEKFALLQAELAKQGLKAEKNEKKVYISEDMGSMQALLPFMLLPFRDQVSSPLAGLPTGGSTYGSKFVQHHSPKQWGGRLKTPGRNEPCSCGSGKKYKQCCGK